MDTALAFVRNVTVQSADQIRIADIVNNEIWSQFPWRWAIGNLTAISTTDDTQDYTITNSDFSTLTKAWLRRTDTSPDEYHMLDIVDFLSPNLTQKRSFRDQRAIAYVKSASSNVLRLEYNVQHGTGVTVNIEGEFKVNPTIVAALSQTITFDDKYLQVLVNGLIYHLYRFDNDPRQGDTQITKNGGIVYTGALGAYKASLEQMAIEEDTYPRTQFPGDSFGEFVADTPWLFF